MTEENNHVEKTNRGFKVYGKLSDQYDSDIKVQESSEVGKPRIWIHTSNRHPDMDVGDPYLDKEQAKELISILQKFVQDAESEDNWRNDPEYKQEFWEEEGD